jgi:hypothetical protein
MSEAYEAGIWALPGLTRSGAVSERPAWGWTTLAMLLTNSWFLSETGRKRLPANVAGAQIGAASRTRRAK